MTGTGSVGRCLDVLTLGRAQVVVFALGRSAIATVSAFSKSRVSKMVSPLTNSY